MCGIAGIFNFDKEKQVSVLSLKEMTDCISYRGPDDNGFYLEENLGLGHRRLAILDVTQGHQPMINDDDSIVIVFNGEIYNFIELRNELLKKGYKFKTQSDTEVIIKAYEEWGVECQNKFNGMWAFALWDKRKSILFISRDRVGEKPLFYSTYKETFVFGSELKSIFSFGVPKKERLELLEIYSVFKFIPAPNTFYEGVFKLMPGNYLIVNLHGIREYKFWDLPFHDEKNLNRNSREIHETFKYLFEDSIKLRMRSDVPFGAFLSGGLDSSSIVSLMSNYSKLPINTFTIGYNDKEFDETELAYLVAEKFKTNHFVGKIEAENLNEALERIVFHYDEPFGDSSAIPTGYVSKFASSKVKMVLTGDGGDEVLSGYSSYQGIKFANKYQSLPLFIQKVFPILGDIIGNCFKNSVRYKINRYNNLLRTSSLSFEKRLIEKHSKPDFIKLKGIFNNSLRQWNVEDYIYEILKNCQYKDEFYKQMFLNFKFDLPNDYLVKVDRMSMAYSLETRLPFLDHRLIEFMTGVDKSIKMEGWERKSVLKNTIAKNLPNQLLKANKKGFRVPVREWIKNKENRLVINKLKQKTEIFNSVIVDSIIEQNNNNESDNGNLIWSLLVLDRLT
jgi:asparagine synthase (glutamine-hydrolysing)